MKKVIPLICGTTGAAMVLFAVPFGVVPLAMGALLYACNNTKA